MAFAIEIVLRADTDLRQLFTAAKNAFGGLPGWSDRRVLDVLTRDVVFVARELAAPVGYIALRREQDGSILVEQLFVAPGHERRGIGRRLLAYAEGYAIAERAAVLYIVAEEDNRPARNFYRRQGFVPVAPELFELVLPTKE